MEIYVTPDGDYAFQHDHSVNDGSFTPSKFYYISWVNLPVDYYAKVAAR